MTPVTSAAVTAVGALGAVAGAALTAGLAGLLGPTNLILVAAILLEGAVVCVRGLVRQRQTMWFGHALQQDDDLLLKRVLVAMERGCCRGR